MENLSLVPKIVGLILMPTHAKLKSELKWIKEIIYSNDFNLDKAVSNIEKQHLTEVYTSILKNNKVKHTPIKKLPVGRPKKKQRKKQHKIIFEKKFLDSMLNYEKPGFGILKKKAIIQFLEACCVLASKILNHPQKKIIYKAISEKWINHKDIEGFTSLIDPDVIENKFLSTYKSLELAAYVFPEKTRKLLVSLLTGLNNQEAGTINGITRERVRQLTKVILKEDRFRKAFNYYNLFESFTVKGKNDNREVFIEEKATKPGLKNKLFINLLTQDFLEEKLKHTYLDIYKNHDLAFKYNHCRYIKSFYVSKILIEDISQEIKSFYDEIFQKNQLVSKAKYSKKLINFLEKYSDIIFDLKKVHFTSQYIYIGSKVSVPFLVELAIKNSNKPTKTLRINEIYDWIKSNFPQKKITSIEGIRGALINSKNIIAFGKTGNYGLKKDFGVEKSSDLSTKNIIIKLLLKKANPMRLDAIEDYVQRKNPFLKDRGVSMIIEINEKDFVKFEANKSKIQGQRYIGLRGKKYLKKPVQFSSKKVLTYIRSKNTEQEWISLKHIISVYKIPKYQIKDFLLLHGYLVFHNMATLSTGSHKKNRTIINLINDKDLINKVEKYISLNIRQKTKFKIKLKKIIELNYGVELNNNEISKIINYIV